MHALSCRKQLPQHKRKDAAIAVVVHLDGRVDTQDHRDLLARAVGARDDKLRLALRLQLGVRNHVDDFRAPELEGLPRFARLELQRQHPMPTRLLR